MQWPVEVHHKTRSCRACSGPLGFITRPGVAKQRVKRMAAMPGVQAEEQEVCWGHAGALEAQWQTRRWVELALCAVVIVMLQNSDRQVPASVRAKDGYNSDALF